MAEETRHDDHVCTVLVPGSDRGFATIDNDGPDRRGKSIETRLELGQIHSWIGIGGIVEQAVIHRVETCDEFGIGRTGKSQCRFENVQFCLMSHIGHLPFYGSFLSPYSLQPAESPNGQKFFASSGND